MSIKPLLKRCSQQVLQGDLPAFVVASFGRSGSTLIYDAILDGIATRFGPIAPTGIVRRISRDTAWQLDKTQLRRGVVYKTHDYPDALAGRQDVKGVFLFGSAKEAALSVYSCLERKGPEGVEEHFRHLHSNLSYDDLLQCDALRFQDQIFAWCAFEAGQVLCLRYEAIWKQSDTLNDFCGFKVPLPPRRARIEKKYSKEIEIAAHAIYGPIDELINQLPDVFIAGLKVKKILHRSL